MITSEQEKKYIKNKGNQCPVCGSSDIECGELNCDGDTAIQEVVCKDCGKEWKDVYTLTGNLEG